MVVLLAVLWVLKVPIWAMPAPLNESISYWRQRQSQWTSDIAIWPHWRIHEDRWNSKVLFLQNQTITSKTFLPTRISIKINIVMTLSRFRLNRKQERRIISLSTMPIIKPSSLKCSYRTIQCSKIGRSGRCSWKIIILVYRHHHLRSWLTRLTVQ